MVRWVPLAEEYLRSIAAIEAEEQGAPWSEQAFRNELTNAVSLFRVGLLNGQVVAYGGLWLVVDEAHVTTVLVASDQRRKGLGRALMNELLTEAKKRGMSCSTLEVRKSNTAAIALYEDLGYVRAAVRKRYYPDNQEDAVVMWLYDLAGWSPR